MNLIVTNKIYDFIVKFKEENDGCAPSRDEMAQAVGLRSKSDIGDHLDELERQGKIVQIRSTPSGSSAPRMIKVVGSQWFSPDNLEMLREDSMKRDS
jgi:SOS-response transcriptional repressor LexA